MTAHIQIVIAWADKTALEPTGRYVTRDLNRFPEYRAAWEGKAAMWLGKGTAADVPKAQAYLDSETYTASAVYTFPPSEQDPLGKARAKAVAAAQESSI